MRVLLANKFFFPNAGAETVYFATRDLLREQGHEVIDFAMWDDRNVASPYERYFSPQRRYDGGSIVSRSRDALATIYSLSTRKSLRRLIRDAGRPDVAHLHNVYHQLTLSIIDELHAHGVPVVLTVHDSKPVCPSYKLFINNEVCHRCVGRSPFSAIRHRCVKGSLLASTIASVEAMVVRLRRLYESVEQLIAPSTFMAELLVRGGIRAERIRVVPNFVRLDPHPPKPVEADSPFIFVGRLEAVKGPQLLVEAVRRLGAEAPDVRILGDGPLARELSAAARGLPIQFAGYVDTGRVAKEMRRARALVVPSLWEENCPMSVLEARSAGTAVVASAAGGLRELVSDGKDGLLFQPSDPADLARALLMLAADDALATEMGHAGWRSALARYSPEVHYPALIDAYEAAMRAGVARRG